MDQGSEGTERLGSGASSSDPDGPKDGVTLEVNLSPEAWSTLASMAAEQEKSFSEMVRDVIAVGHTVQVILDGGGRMLARTRAGDMYELTFDWYGRKDARRSRLAWSRPWW